MGGGKLRGGVGWVGMVTVADVLGHDLRTLTQWLGDREGEWLWARVHGVSDSAVETGGGAKSISRDETFAGDLSDDRGLEREVLGLVTRAAFDKRGDGLAARTITVRIRGIDFRKRSARR